MKRVGLSLFFLLVTFLGWGQPHVVFINPGFATDNDTGPFWRTVSEFMRAAAKDLNIRLTILYANRNHIYMRTLAKEVDVHSPDYVILVNEKHSGPVMVKNISGRYPILFLLNGLDSKELASLASERRASLLGSIVPNNFEAGKQLALQLLKLGQKQKEGPFNALALLGDYATPAALERERGVRQVFLNNQDRIRLIDTPVANWSLEAGYAKTKGILLHANRVDLIWSANDVMAFGARRASLELERDIIIGGINWDKAPNNLATDVSLGGHMTLGAYGLVALYDMHLGLMSKRNKMRMFDIFVSDAESSSQKVKALIEQNKIQDIDFRRFSLSAKKPLSFSIENLAQAASNH